MPYTEVICDHEAAHAVCAWFVGFEVAQVHVLSDADRLRRRWMKDRFGKELKGALGHTEYRRRFFSGADRYARNGAYTLKSHSKARIVAAAAGPISTALWLDGSLHEAFLGSGLDDRQTLYNVRVVANIDQKTMGKILQNVALFLASPAGSRAVLEVRRRLAFSGRLNGWQINRLCRVALRRQTGYDLLIGKGLKSFHDAKRNLRDQVTRPALTPSTWI